MADASNAFVRHKGLLLCLSSLVLLTLVGFCYAVSAPTALRVRFICTTKQDSGVPGTVLATFQIENNLNELLRVRGAFIEESKGNGWKELKPVIFADPVRGNVTPFATFLAAATNTFCCLIPTNPGPYKLYLTCNADSSLAPSAYLNLRRRLADLMFRLAPPRGPGPKPLKVKSMLNLCRVEGGICATTEPFHPTQFEDLLQRAAVPLLPSTAPTFNSAPRLESVGPHR